jgi:MipA family protein
MIIRCLAVAGVFLASGGFVHAADATSIVYSEPAPVASGYGDDDFVFELGIGALVSPDYDGADSYGISPSPYFSVEYLSIPGIGSFGGKDGLGLSFGPSFGYTGKREADDHADLAGLDDVDATYEAGLRVGYEWEHFEVYGAGRYAFGGADGFIGDLGANYILRPTPALTIKAGPVVTFASSGYTDAYFGVSPAEAAASGGRFAAYEADGGFKNAGVEASAKYEFRPDWYLNAEASYTRLIGDAADSPVVDAGSENQFTFGVGISKRFSLDLF